MSLRKSQAIKINMEEIRIILAVVAAGIIAYYVGYWYTKLCDSLEAYYDAKRRNQAHPWKNKR